MQLLVRAIPSFVCLVLSLAACGPRAQPPSTTLGGSTSPSVAASSGVPASVTPTLAPVSSPGYIEGRATIGPLQPVERVGVPTPTPPSGACTTRGLVIYASDTGVEVQRVSLGPDCTYRVALAPGSYQVELDKRGIDTSRDLPRVVTVMDGQTTRLDFSVDTGIR